MKIGITTYYHENANYGGQLQAYALCKAINNVDQLDAEQIQAQIGYSQKSSKLDKLKKASNPCLLTRYIYYKISSKLTKKITDKLISDKLSRRDSIFHTFEKSIPHSEREYTSDNISDCASDYDLFITGSDQVWNYRWYNPSFFLGFTNAPKISYAASIGHSSIPNEWKEYYRNHFKDFTAISVREEEAVAMLQPLSPVPVEWVLDPTMLLSASEWDEICAPRMVNEPYLFCYFLGGSKHDRKVANAVAKKKGLKIVTLPHILGSYRVVDENFGDIQLWDVGPKEFISLIKYSEFVLTDSFHGTVFSNHYRRPFAAFEREGEKGMGGRLASLTDLTDTQDRFLTTPAMANADYIYSLPDKLPEETEKVRMMREKSMSFLKRNIEIARQIQEKDHAQ